MRIQTFFMNTIKYVQPYIYDTEVLAIRVPVIMSIFFQPPAGACLFVRNFRILRHGFKNRMYLSLIIFTTHRMCWCISNLSKLYVRYVFIERKQLCKNPCNMT